MPNGANQNEDSEQPTKTGSVLLVQVLATIFLLAVIGYYLYLSWFGNSYFEFDIFQIISLALVGLAFIVGITGIWLSNISGVMQISEEYQLSWNTVLVAVAIVFLWVAPIFGLWESLEYRDIGELSLFDYLMITGYGMSMLIFIELGHEAVYFAGIKKFAKRFDLKQRDFSLNAVIGSYFIWFVILMALIGIISFGILELTKFIIALFGDGVYLFGVHIGGWSPQFADSIILNSIYGVAIAMAVVFIPLLIIFALIFGEWSLIRSEKTLLFKTAEEDETPSTLMEIERK